MACRGRHHRKPAAPQPQDQNSSKLADQDICKFVQSWNKTFTTMSKATTTNAARAAASATTATEAKQEAEAARDTAKQVEEHVVALTSEVREIKDRIAESVKVASSAAEQTQAALQSVRRHAKRLRRSRRQQQQQ
eukprot:gnl/Spiro4/22035_TR10835_c2_g1_i1.p2 gnl/Spiro4/22035_TR10835_c2_g1~~gnl/Spiro4/22035_TR10835_c2_g1_i1.p2  ORF type:complete len:135 (+),score=25.87 gnl/Spiro4/22035_TR10835_c2_g1_i1:750-1154(+)